VNEESEEASKAVALDCASNAEFDSSNIIDLNKNKSHLAFANPVNITRQRLRSIHTANFLFQLAPGDPPGAQDMFDFPIQNRLPLKR